jgi:hypothetical protein
MRHVLAIAFVSTALATSAHAAPDEQDSGQASTESVQAVGAGVRLTAAVVAVPLRVAAQIPGAVLKQTFTGLGEGSREDPFTGTPLKVDDEVLSNRQTRPTAMRAQPAPTVPREAVSQNAAN